jgi:hypothetical protein
MEPLGFIILRHVNSLLSSSYWKHSYTCVRKYHPDSPILLVDDNSNPALIDRAFEATMTKTTIVQGEFPARGEVLPYYYYLKYPLFETAVILHDSVFLNSAIDFTVDSYKLLWYFEHTWDQPKDEITILKHLNDSEELLAFHADKKKWKGCFGGMTVVKYDFLKRIDDKHCIGNMLPHITSRYNRMSFERVIGCLFQAYGPYNCMLGDIKKYCVFGTPLSRINTLRHLPIIKVWSGR